MRDPEKALARKRRYRERQKVAKHGPQVAGVDLRGKHHNHAKGPDAPRWSNEKMIASNGYVKLRVGKTHPLADPNGYAYEHEIVWASAGLPSPGPGDVHHHKNEVKTDNRIENIEIKPRPTHGVEHNPTALLDHEVVAIRDAYQGGDHTGTLAKRYGVPVQYVWKIVRGKTRRLAGGPAPRRLFIGEGIETVLSVATALRRAGALRADDAFWSSVDLGNLGGRADGTIAHPTLKTPGGRAQRLPGPQPDFDAPAIALPASLRDLVLLGDGDSERVLTETTLERARRRGYNHAPN